MWIADPKAANHILQKSGYLYAKPGENQEISALFNDFGLPSVEGELSATDRSSRSSDNPTGEVHKRQRRAVAPAFGLVEARGLLPHFMDAVTKVGELRLCSILGADLGPHHQMADKWSNIIANDKSGNSATVDVSAWLGKATLDAYVQVLVSGIGAG